MTSSVFVCAIAAKPGTAQMQRFDNKAADAIAKLPGALEAS